MLKLHRSSVNPQSRTRKQPCRPRTPVNKSIHTEIVAMASVQVRTVSFKNQKDQQLVGTLTVADQAVKQDHGSKSKCVILCHGYASHKEGFQLPALAAALATAGFNSLRFDFSGNGDSEGAFRLSGYRAEADEIHAAKQYLEQEERQQVVALLGHSKAGGDVVIYAATYDDIPLVINVSGRFWMQDGLKQRFGNDIFERVQQGPVKLTATRDDGYSFDWSLTQEDLQERLSLDMAAFSAGTKQSRVLNIHGAADSTISVEDAKQFAAHIAGSELVIVPDADHNFRVGETAQPMIDAVVRFIKGNSNPQVLNSRAV